MAFSSVLLLGITAAEIVTLQSGLTLRVDAVRVRDGMVVLQQADGETVVPPSAIRDIEPVPDSRPNVTPEPQPAIAGPGPINRGPRELVRAAAERHGLPVAFVESVARAESAFDPNAQSPKGAIGLMQLMPQTAATLGVDPFDPEQNADGGARLLRQLLLQYQAQPDQVRRALAAYNAGSGAVRRYNGVPPFRETREYVERVLRQYRSAPKP